MFFFNTGRTAADLKSPGMMPEEGGIKKVNKVRVKSWKKSVDEMRWEGVMRE